jgi:hypothetical protein
MTRMKRRRLAPVVAASFVLLAATATGVAALVPSSGGPVSSTNYPVNVGSSTDAYDPHVDGDLVTYTAGNKIRYYDFFTGDDMQVPSPAGATDFLSDVSGQRIVFTRNIAGSSRVMVFDTASATTTELDPQLTSVRSNPAIGADRVAFVDLADGTGELYMAYLGVPPAQQVTYDDRYDQNPNMAPDGGFAVFESCATDPSDCDIYAAIFTLAHWAPLYVSTTPEPEANPATDGNLIAYDAIRAGERDIYWQAMSSLGTEVRLDLPGEQRNPSINKGIVSFESIAPGASAADVFLYEIATNRLFQVTSTEGIDESLNDIFVMPNGTVRAVWAQGPFGDRDVRGADLLLPPVGPTYNFGGFKQPVDARPTLNSMKAGAAVPVKFSLGGNQGLNVFQAGYPKSQSIACDSTADVDGIETTVNAGGSSLTYDPATNTYTYIWKTDKAWAGTCRQLVFEFADAGSTTARANFKFK